MEELLKILEDEKYNYASKETKELAVKCYKEIEPYCDEIKIGNGPVNDDDIELKLKKYIEKYDHQYYLVVTVQHFKEEDGWKEQDSILVVYDDIPAIKYGFFGFRYLEKEEQYYCDSVEDFVKTYKHNVENFGELLD